MTAQLQRRRVPRARRQPHVGDRAVDRVVLGAVGVGVDPADEVPCAARSPTPRTCTSSPGQLEVAARRASRAPASPRAPGPPSAWRAPSSESAPFAIQGVVERAELDRARAPRRASVALPSKSSPCSQIQRSACCGAPVVADHPAPAVERDRVARRRCTRPPKRAAGTGLSSFVRGQPACGTSTRAGGGAAGSLALESAGPTTRRTSPSLRPRPARTRRRRPRSSPRRRPPAPGAGHLVRARPPGAPSNSVNQSDPFGGSPGRLCTV